MPGLIGAGITQRRGGGDPEWVSEYSIDYQAESGLPIDLTGGGTHTFDDGTIATKFDTSPDVFNLNAADGVNYELSSTGTIASVFYDETQFAALIAKGGGPVWDEDKDLIWILVKAQPNNLSGTNSRLDIKASWTTNGVGISPRVHFGSLASATPDRTQIDISSDAPLVQDGEKVNPVGSGRILVSLEKTGSGFRIRFQDILDAAPSEPSDVTLTPWTDSNTLVAPQSIGGIGADIDLSTFFGPIQFLTALSSNVASQKASVQGIEVLRWRVP